MGEFTLVKFIVGKLTMGGFTMGQITLGKLTLTPSLAKLTQNLFTLGKKKP